MSTKECTTQILFCFTSIDIFWKEAFITVFKETMCFRMNGIRINRASLAKSWTREEDFCFCSLLWELRENSKVKRILCMAFKKEKSQPFVALYWNVSKHTKCHCTRRRDFEQRFQPTILSFVSSHHIRAVELLVSRTWCKKNLCRASHTFALWLYVVKRRFLCVSCFFNLLTLSLEVEVCPLLAILLCCTRCSLCFIWK